MAKKKKKKKARKKAARKTPKKTTRKTRKKSAAPRKAVQRTTPKATPRTRMIGLAAAAPCALTRNDVSNLVVLFVRAQGFPAATEFSNFSVDIPVDGITRRGWAAPIRQRVFDAGCDPHGFGPSDCEGAKKVGGIVDALAKELA